MKSFIVKVVPGSLEFECVCSVTGVFVCVCVCVRVCVGERGAVMSLQFTDAEFQSSWRELDEPQLEGGWELFVETMGVKIYRLYDKVQTGHKSAASTAGTRLLVTHWPKELVRIGFLCRACSSVSSPTSCPPFQKWCEIVIFDAVHLLTTLVKPSAVTS